MSSRGILSADTSRHGCFCATSCKFKMNFCFVTFVRFSETSTTYPDVIILDVSDDTLKATKASNRTNDVIKRKCDVTVGSASVINVEDSVTSPKPVNGVIDLCDTTSSENTSSVYFTPDEKPKNQSRLGISEHNNKSVSNNDNQLLSSQSPQDKATSREDKDSFSTMHTSTPLATNGSSAVGATMLTPQESPVLPSVSDTPSRVSTSDKRYQLILISTIPILHVESANRLGTTHCSFCGTTALQKIWPFVSNSN